MTNWLKRNLILCIFFTSLILLLVVGCSKISNNTYTGAKVDTPNQERIKEVKGSQSSSGEFVTEQFFITGFTWASCASTAQGILSRLDGVKEAKVEQSGDAMITYNAGKVDLDKFKEVLKPYNYQIDY